MYYYLVSMMFFSLSALIFSKLRMSVACFMLSIPFLMFISIFRGDVGVDTYTYLTNIRYIIVGERESVFEPGFEILIRVIGFFGFNEREIMMSLSFLISCILFFSFYKLEKNKPYILLFLVIPTFYFDMTMNGIRYGLSFSIIVYAISLYIKKGSLLSYAFLSLMAGSVHISGLLLGLLLLFIVNRKSWSIYIILGSVAITCVCLFVYLVGSEGFIFNKINAYSDMQSPSFGSGFSIMLISCLTLFHFLIFENNCKDKFFICIMGFTLASFTFFISQISYAGLRLQGVVLFLIFIVYAVKARQLYDRKWDCFIAMFAIGVLSFIFKLNNFIDGENIGFSPFIPYRFIWEVYD